MPNDRPLIALRDAAFGYAARAVVRVAELEVRPHQVLGIYGPNGSGKTTLVRGMIGLLAPMSGASSRDSQAKLAYLPQRAAMEDHWPMSAYDAAALVVSAHRRFGWIGGARRQVISAMRAQQVDHLADRPFFSLSGGQQQRVLLAAALAGAPQALLLDEPAAGLDIQSRRDLLAMLRSSAAGGLAVVIISHEIEDLIELCDHVAWLRPGAEPGMPSHVDLVSRAQLLTHFTLQKQPA